MQLRFALYTLCVAALALGACDGRRLGLSQFHLYQDPMAPVSDEEIASVDWSAPEEFRITLIEFGILPEEPTLTLGKTYRLELRNIGDNTFEFAAKDFFETSVIRDMEAQFVELHGSTPHEEKPIAHLREYPTGLDSDPASKGLADGAVAEETAEDVAGEDKPHSDDEASSMAEDANESEAMEENAHVQLVSFSVPPNHAAVMTLVPLRAGRFPLLGPPRYGLWTKITVEDPGAEENPPEDEASES